jgi:putative membrane protein
MADPILTDSDRLAIREAIAAAEKNTSGEIFAVVAMQSDDYRLVPILWATLVALIFPLPFVLLEMPGDWSMGAGAVTGSPWLSLPAIYLGQMALFVILALLLSLPRIKALVVPALLKRARARSLALDQFLAHGLHTTEERTGVLIFVSLFERYAEIVADSGIAAKVDQGEWDASLGGLIGHIRSRRLGHGLLETVGRTGDLLARHFPPRPRDRNELPNDLILL